jgi:monoamine oxidase
MPAGMQARLNELLHTIHPMAPVIPDALGSAFVHWGSDPRETAWTFWRDGFRSDDVIPLAVQPDRSVPIYVAGESFSRSQGWAEGALETAAAVVDRVLADVPPA